MKDKLMILTLTKKLNYLNKKYYQEHVSEVSDAEYDKLMAQLKDLEAKHPEWVQPNTPTKKVGSDSVDGFKKVAHSYPMLSLQDIYTEEELTKFINSTGETEFSVECKLDGLSLSLIYENGQLVRAVTRGDGSQGDDVTAQAKCIETIPKTLKFKGKERKVNVEVRGEVVMPFDAFEKYNAACTNEKDKFANPRNAASGTLKSYDPHKCEERGLQFVAYYLDREGFIGVQNYGNGDSGIMSILDSWGFITPATYDGCDTVKSSGDMIAVINRIKSHQYPFPIDGVVVKCNERKSWERLGYTDKFYKWGIAFKFKQESLRSTLQSVDWQVAESGKVTPVANYTPIQMFGTTCRRATLNNWEWMQKNLFGLCIGDTLLLTKGGEIIPKITGYEPSYISEDDISTMAVEPPTHCPVCGERLTKQGAHLFCLNEDCAAKHPDKPKAKAPVAKAAPVAATSDKLKGKVFLVSGNFGTPERRKELERMIVENGGTLSKGVTLSVNYYLLPDDVEEWKHKAGSKWMKILNYMHQDRIINQYQFEQLIK